MKGEQCLLCDEIIQNDNGDYLCPDCLLEINEETKIWRPIVILVIVIVVLILITNY